MNDSMLKGNTNLFVVSIDSSMTSERLQTVFSEYGNVVSCEVAEENDKRKGFAFVQYDSVDSADSVINALHESHEFVLEGKKLVRENTSEESELTEDLLFERFSENGNVHCLVIIKDNAGKSKEFGFVAYESHEDANKAIQALNGAVIESQKLFVDWTQNNAAGHALLLETKNVDWNQKMVKSPSFRGDEVQVELNDDEVQVERADEAPHFPYVEEGDIISSMVKIMLAMLEIEYKAVPIDD